MKKLVASVGLAALGASSLQVAYGQAVATASSQKPWSVSATLRGFYDDNINSTSTDKQHSLGVEVSPAGTFAMSTEQTVLSLGYVYSVKDDDKKQINADSHYDQDHTLNAALTHNFNEKDQLNITDSFVVGQEPDMLRAGNTFSSYQYVSGYNFRNYGTITFDGKATRLLGYEVGYDNAYYDYADTTQTIGDDGNVIPSNAGTLNRLEHGVHLEARWEVQPETFGVLGFRFRETDYTGDQPIAGPAFSPGSGTVMSDQRNSRTYAPYVGVIHTFTPELTGSLDIGANYADYFNDPTTQGDWSPYVSLSGKYNYGPESYVSVGFTHDRNSTSITSPNALANNTFQVTEDQESSTIFASLNHRFTSKIYGSVIAQMQSSTFNGGAVDNESEQYYLAGLDLEYRFNMHFAGHVGYNFDHLEAPAAVGGSWNRNRVYLGVTATY